MNLDASKQAFLKEKLIPKTQEYLSQLLKVPPLRLGFELALALG